MGKHLLRLDVIWILEDRAYEETTLFCEIETKQNKQKKRKRSERSIFIYIVHILHILEYYKTSPFFSFALTASHLGGPSP